MTGIIQVTNLLNALPAQFGNAHQIGGDGFQGTKQTGLDRYILDRRNPAETATMDTCLEVVGITATIKDAFGHRYRTGSKIILQITHLRTDFNDQKT